MITIMCDSCNRDLTSCEQIMDFRLNVKCERIPMVSGIVIDVMIYPPIDRELNFCGIGCLNKYFR